MHYFVFDELHNLKEALQSCIVEEKFDGSSFSFMFDTNDNVYVGRRGFKCLIDISELQKNKENFSYSYLKSAAIYLDKIKDKLSYTPNVTYHAEVLYKRYPNVIEYNFPENRIILFTPGLLNKNENYKETLSVNHIYVDSYTGPIKTQDYQEDWLITENTKVSYTYKDGDFLLSSGDFEGHLYNNDVMFTFFKDYMSINRATEGFVVNSSSGLLNTTPGKIVNPVFPTKKNDIRSVHRAITKIKLTSRNKMASPLTDLAQVIIAHNNTEYKTDFELKWKARRNEEIFVALQSKKMWSMFNGW